MQKRLSKQLSDKIELNHGAAIPQHGFGVFLISDAEEADTVIHKALDVGYRSFDTAQSYENEGLLGDILKRGGCNRDDLFITTKISNRNQGYDQTLVSFEHSLQKLKLEQVDLLLVHWPSQRHFFDTWRALERLYEQKLVRSIGVCNYKIHHLELLQTKANVKPALNQIELHPYLTQHALREYLFEHDIAVEAWSPLGRGAVLQDAAIEEIGKRHNKSTAQVILRWHLQHNTIVIPKSSTPSRIAQNVDIYDFELSPEELNAIDHLNRDLRTGPDPDEIYLKI